AVIDQVIVAARLRYFGDVDAVFALDLLQRIGRAGQIEDAGVKIRGVGFELIGRIARRIDRDEDRLHFARLVADHVECLADRLQGGRAGIGAIGVAEIDQHDLAAEILIAPYRAVLIDQGEGPADGRARVLRAAEPELLIDDPAENDGERGDEDVEPATDGFGHGADIGPGPRDR